MFPFRVSIRFTSFAARRCDTERWDNKTRNDDSHRLRRTKKADKYRECIKWAASVVARRHQEERIKRGEKKERKEGEE